MTANLSKMAAESEARSEVRYFAGDWSEMHKILPFAPDNVVKLSGSCDPGQVSGYDIVLMAETVYSLSTLKTLYKLITQVRTYTDVHLMLYYYYSFINSNVVLNILIVLEPSSWSCILGWKEALLWSWRRNSTLSICVRKRR